MTKCNSPKILDRQEKHLFVRAKKYIYIHIYIYIYIYIYMCVYVYIYNIKK